MGHVTNAVLYEFDPASKSLMYRGDAIKAARVAGNLEEGETFQKFHCSPIWFNARYSLSTWIIAILMMGIFHTGDFIGLNPASQRRKILDLSTIAIVVYMGLPLNIILCLTDIL